MARIDPNTCFRSTRSMHRGRGRTCADVARKNGRTPRWLALAASGRGAVRFQGLPSSFRAGKRCQTRRPPGDLSSRPHADRRPNGRIGVGVCVNAGVSDAGRLTIVLRRSGPLIAAVAHSMGRLEQPSTDRRRGIRPTAATGRRLRAAVARDFPYRSLAGAMDRRRDGDRRQRVGAGGASQMAPARQRPRHARVSLPAQLKTTRTNWIAQGERRHVVSKKTVRTAPRRPSIPPRSRHPMCNRCSLSPTDRPDSARRSFPARVEPCR